MSNLWTFETIIQHIKDTLDSAWYELEEEYKNSSELENGEFLYFNCNYVNSIFNYCLDNKIEALELIKCLEYINEKKSEFTGEDITYEDISNMDKIYKFMIYFVGEDWKYEKLIELESQNICKSVSL